MFLAAALLLAGCTSPTPRTPDEIDALIALNDKTFELVLKSVEGAPEAEIQAAVRELIHSFKVAGPQITAATTQLAQKPWPKQRSIDPMDISVCIQVNASRVPSLEKLPVTLQPSLLSASMDCAALTDAYFLHVKPNDADLDFVTGVAYPIALAINARIDADHALPVGLYLDLIESYQRNNAKLIGKLAPDCHESRMRTGAQTVEVHYQCESHDGQQAHGREIYRQGRLVTLPLDRAAINAAATRLTSRGLAMALQPKLDALSRALSAHEARVNNVSQAGPGDQPAR